MTDARRFILSPLVCRRSRLAGERPRRAFTMIELLIVVSIIGILASIAIPNFLQAQTRAKVARAKTEMAMLELSLEQYYLDQKAYPPNQRTGYGLDTDLYRLTTPFVYATQLPQDPFAPRGYPPTPSASTGYAYCLAIQSASAGLNLAPYGIRGRAYYLLQSRGPDLDGDIAWGTPFPPPLVLYDPTNGTVSNGDVIHFGPH